MLIYTIGFTKKTAEEFFELLRQNNVKKVIDIRLNNKSQLAGFAKGDDLRYFLDAILNIQYIYDIRLAPTKALFDNYKAKKINKNEFETEFRKIMMDRDFNEIILNEYKEQLSDACLLCSEHEANECHRRIIAEYIKELIPEVEIVHL